MSKRTVYKNAKLRHEANLSDFVVCDGKFVEIGAGCGEKYKDAKVVDLEGRLTCEPYVESHIHLDYVYTAALPAEETTSGTLFEAIDRWSDSKHLLTKESIKARAYKGINKEVSNGVQYIRTHVDVTDPKLTAVKAMLEVKEEVKDLIDMQLIAFPQEGMYAYKGGADLVEEAVKMGCDVVGGIPHFEHTREDGVNSVKKAIEIAMKYDKLVDLHCDETDDEQSRFVEVLASMAYDSGMLDKVTASHTCAMSSYNNAYAFKLFHILSKSKINFVSCPTENIYLQGRYDTYPKRRGLTRIKELTEAGMNVSFAQDSISDPWYPLGNGNLIHQVDFGLHCGHMMRVPEINRGLDFITKNGAKTLKLSDGYDMKVGNDASFIVLDAQNEFEAIRERAQVILSIRKGEVLVEKTPVQYKVNRLQDRIQNKKF